MLPVWSRPDGMDEWTEEQMAVFGDNLNHHLLVIARAVGRPPREVFWLWHRVLGDLPGDEILPAFVVNEWARMDRALRRRWTVEG